MRTRIWRPGLVSFLTAKGDERMKRGDLLQRISIDPNICFGKPCIRGHRIWVSFVLDLLANGWTCAEILENYPGIEEADILACIVYGAEMSPHVQ